MTAARAGSVGRRREAKPTLESFTHENFGIGDSDPTGGGGSPARPGSTRSQDQPLSQRWAEEVSEFVQAKRSEATVGEAWLRRLDWELGRFPRLVLRQCGGTPPRSVHALAPVHILALRSVVRWEKATYAIHFAALRQFARWAGNPIALQSSVWKLPSGQPSHRRWLSKKQILRLLASAQGLEKLLVGLEALNGLRRVEVLRLRGKDILRDERSLRVLGKGRNGGKWRQIPLNPSLSAILPPFVKGLPADARLIPVGRSGADCLLRRAAERAGFTADGVKVSHHDLRRTFGRLAHESGMDLIQLKNLYGHASIEMTVHYIGLDADRMRAGLERLHRNLGLDEAGRTARQSA